MAGKIKEPKKRILLRLFDVLKALDPISMGSAALDELKDIALERQGLLQVKGYYNLWEAMIDAEQGLPHLKRVFKKQVTPRLLTEMRKLSRSMAKSVQY